MDRDFTTEAIVLSATDVGEEDRILTFLTPDRGILRAAASGARNLRKGRSAPLDLFVKTMLQVNVPRKSGSLNRVRSTQVLEPHLGIRSDYERLCVASFIGEVTSKCIQEDDPSKEVFALVSMVLGILERGEGAYRALLLFEGRLLKELGLSPDTAICRKCGSGIASNAVIDPALGGFVDERCASGGRTGSLTIGDLAVVRFVLTRDIGALPRLRIDEERAKHIFNQLNRFAAHHLGFLPRTLKTLP